MSTQRDDHGILRISAGTVGDGGRFAAERVAEAAESIPERGITVAPDQDYVVMSGGLIVSGETGRLYIDADLLDDDVDDMEDDEREEHIARLVQEADELAARNLTDWMEIYEDRIRELAPTIYRRPVTAIPEGTGPQVLIAQGGLIRTTVNADTLLIVDLDELLDQDINDDRRQALMTSLAAAGGAGGEAYERIRVSADRFFAPYQPAEDLVGAASA